MFPSLAQKISFALGVLWAIPFGLYFLMALFDVTNSGSAKHVAIAGFWLFAPILVFWWLTGVLWPIVDKLRSNK